MKNFKNLEKDYLVSGHGLPVVVLNAEPEHHGLAEFDCFELRVILGKVSHQNLECKGGHWQLNFETSE